MTSRAAGTVSKNPVLVPSYTRASSATNLQNNRNLVDGSPPAQVIVQPSTIVDGVTTRMPDQPGMVPLPFRVFFTSVRDVRSAATNTALAFGLDGKKSADRAALYQKLLADKTFANAPAVADDSVIIPP